MEKDNVEFWFEEKCIDPLDLVQLIQLGGDNRNIERTLRRHKVELEWVEPKRGNGNKRKIKKEKRQDFDLISEYEEGHQWHVRCKCNRTGGIRVGVKI